MTKQGEAEHCLTDSLEADLYEAMCAWDVIDAHEHLPPEEERLARSVDVFTLVSHYTHGDLLTAGMTEVQYSSLFDREVPLERRWGLFEPFWARIRHASYARAARLAARRFYGVPDISRQTYEELSLAISENNTPGLYQRVLMDLSLIHI